MLESCGVSPSRPKESPKADSAIPSVVVNLKADPADAPSAWQYSDQEDKMTSKKIYFATVDAKDLLQLNFPYNGGSTASLLIQYRDGQSYPVLEVTKGQFMAGVDGEDIRIRFDEGKAMTFSGNSPADEDTKVLFITPAARFIEKLKKAKRIIIQAEMFNDGTQTMEFDTENLIWKH